MLLSLRLGENDHKNSKYIDRLIETLKESGNAFDEVWIASSYGLLSIEQCRENTDKMKEAAEKFKKANIVASMQISRTIGHTNSINLEGVENLETDLITDINGIESAGIFCFNNQPFRNYIFESLKEYAKLEPYICWVDDDLRIRNLGKSYALCFCKTCIAKYNRKYNHSYTRENLKNDFLHNEKIRKEYIDFQTDCLNEFCSIISNAFISVSPDTVMALQNGGNTSLATNAQRVCLDTMKSISGKNPAFRAGGGFYHDHNPYEMLTKAIQINFLNSRLPEYVKMRSCEIENLPFVAYGKSPECTPVEATLYMAYGCNMASVTLMFPFEPLSYHKEMCEKLSVYKPYLKMLAKTTENTKNGGVCVYQPVNSHLANVSINCEKNWNATSIFEAVPLMRCGIPFNAEKSGDTYFLSSKACDYVTEEDMEILLKSPVVTDALSLEKLFDRGFSDKIFANVELLPDSLQSAVYEKISTHAVNNGLTLEHWHDSRWDSADKRYMITGNDIEVISDWYSYNPNRKVGCAGAIVKTSYGAKWYVKGAHLCNDVISFERRNQLVNAINYISEKPISAYVGTPQQIVIVPRTDENGNTVSITLLNVSTTEYKDVEIVVNNPSSVMSTVTDPYTESVSLPLIKKGNSYSVKIESLKPWCTKTLYF